MKTFKVGNDVWLRVDRTFPCPICGKTDWCCINEQQTQAVCMREIDMTKPQLFDGTLYNLSSTKKVSIKVDKNATLQKLETASHLHKVYSLVIKVLGLTKEHTAHLVNERGLTTEQIALRGYASATKETLNHQIVSYQIVDGKPVIKTIWEDLFVKNGLSKDAWRGVPGFSYNDQVRQPVFNVGKYGILIPARNAWGQIVRMQIRVDKSELSYKVTVNEGYSQYKVNVKYVDGEGLKYFIRSAETFETISEGVLPSMNVTFSNGMTLDVKPSSKYIFVSSASRDYGTAAPATAHFSFPDAVLAQAVFDEDGKSRVHLVSKCNNIIMTEGLLKADIISSLGSKTQLKQLGSSVLVVAMTGVSVWERVAKTIVRNTKFSEINLAFDQDFEDNNQVFERLRETVRFFRGHHINSTVMTWENGKGLDDFLLDYDNVELISYHQYH